MGKALTAVQCFAPGFATLTGRNASVIIPEARLEIIRQMTITYIQSVLKYSTLVRDGLQNGEDVEKYMVIRILG